MIILSYLCSKNRTMLGIDSKRETVKGKFARRIWNEVLAIWLGKEKPKQKEDDSKFEVIWQ